MTSYTKKWFLQFCAFAPLALCVSSWAGSSPTLIPYQGRLTNPQGVPYTNGQYTIAFTLYDQPVGGTVIWGPETHSKVGVINGMVNVFLGSINPLTNVDFSVMRHLGITIYADNNPNNPAPEMVPRQMIIPAFWAKNSEKLAGQDWTPIFGVNSPVGFLPGSKIQPSSITTSQVGDGQITLQKLSSQAVGSLVVPPGTLLPYSGSTEPAGYLFCYGQPISRTTFAALFAAIGTTYGAGDGSTTFNLPDLRGRTIAGRDNMGGTGANRLTSTGTGNPGLDGTNLGAAGGADRYILSNAQMPTHNHGGLTGSMDRNSSHSHVETSDGNGGSSGIQVATTSSSGSRTTSNSTLSANTDHEHSIPNDGSSQPHPIVQPTIVLNYIVKY